MELKDRLKNLREDNDLKQDTIAKMLGIRQNVYSRYETGKNEMPIHHLIKICIFYNVSADYFLGLSEKRPLK